MRLAMPHLRTDSPGERADTPAHVLGSLARQDLDAEWDQQQERMPRLDPALRCVSRPHAEHEQDAEHPNRQPSVVALQFGRDGDDCAFV